MSEFKFSCPACGQDILCNTMHAGTQIACPACNASITVPAEAAGSATVSHPTDNPPPLPGDAASAVQRTSGLAIASLVCSLSSLITCVGWLPGIICGHLARSRIRRDPSLKGSGLATAGLLISYLILFSEVGVTAVYVWRLSSAVKQGIESVQHNLETNNIILTQTQSPIASHETQTTEPAQTGIAATNSPPAKSVPAEATVVNSSGEPKASGWTTALGSISFPDHRVSGRLNGHDFTLTNAQLRGGDLRLRSANRLMLDVYRLGTNVPGHSYFIHTDDVARANPHVRITWSEEDVVQTATFSRGFAMKLQFGPAVNRTMSGKIYLCLPDDAKSYVAGTFKVRRPRRR